MARTWWLAFALHVPQDSPLLKLPVEGLAAHAIEALGTSEHGVQLFAATVCKKQQGR